MDFGRLAYKRLEEFEHAMRSTRTERMRNTGFSIRPNFFINELNPYRITTASGSGRQSLLVKINANVLNTGRIVLLIDGQKVGFSDFLTLGNSEQVLMINCRFSNQTAALSLQAQNGLSANLISLQAVLIGEGAHFARRVGGFSADESGRFLGVLYSKNDNLQLNRYPLSTLANPTVFSIGRGLIADTCGDGNGGFYVGYVDNNQNFWIIHINEVGAIRRLQINETAVTSLAITLNQHEQFVQIAFVKNGRIFYLSVSLDLSSSTKTLPLDTERADIVDFVKGATSPTLLASREGRIFVRKPLSDLKLLKRRLRHNVVINSSATFNAI